MNGIAERAQQCIIRALKALPDDAKDMWPDALPLLTRAENVAVSASGLSRYELTFARPPTTSLDMLLQQDASAARAASNTTVDPLELLPSLKHARELITSYAAAYRQMEKARDNKYKEQRKVPVPVFSPGDQVVYYRPTATQHKSRLQFQGPFEVLERTGSSLYKLRLLSTGKVLEGAALEHIQKYKPSLAPKTTIPDPDPVPVPVSAHPKDASRGEMLAFRHKEGYLLGLMDGIADPDDGDEEDWLSIHLYAPRGLQWLPVWYDRKDGKAILDWRKRPDEARWLMPIPRSSVIATVTFKPRPVAASRKKGKGLGILDEASRRALQDFVPSKL